VGHYEITRYGTLYTWAGQLGFEDAAALLKETLIEEENTDDILSRPR
jgi:ferritin-like metal-binding protein YciE